MTGVFDWRDDFSQCLCWFWRVGIGWVSSFRPRHLYTRRFLDGVLSSGKNSATPPGDSKSPVTRLIVQLAGQTVRIVQSGLFITDGTCLFRLAAATSSQLSGKPHLDT